ncbi:MAG: HDIG domain-containing protein [Candidatus Zixiibacteriota bacterium]|nr:MAG: HDIG domain-containing protein [candidate division Zixibacteria bacterium]
MLSRSDALALVQQHVPNRNLVKHMIAVEAVMRRLARRFGEDEEVWSLAGLLHDLDYMETAEAFDRHGFRTAEILAGKDVPAEALHAIMAHPGHLPRESRMDQALYAVDPLTGLIVAGALMHPQKKLAALDVEYLLRRFKEKRFAAGADRGQIQSCAELGLPLEEFLRLGLEGMNEVSGELGF